MITRFFIAIAAMALLAACSKEQAVLAPPCPSTVIVKELADITQFKSGEGRDLTDVVLEGTITGFDGFCETDFDEGVAGEVTIDLRVLFRASRGPANTDRKGTFRYFVVIADRDDNPLRKDVFATAVQFPGNRNRVAPFEELSLAIPLKAGQNGGDYRVLVGFQLTPDQIEYNRSRQIR